MTTPLSVTPAERITAQRAAYRYFLKRDKWKQDNVSIHLLPPMELAAMFTELKEWREFKRSKLLPTPMTSDKPCSKIVFYHGTLNES